MCSGGWEITGYEWKSIPEIKTASGDLCFKFSPTESRITNTFTFKLRSSTTSRTNIKAWIPVKLVLIRKSSLFAQKKSWLLVYQSFKAPPNRTSPTSIWSQKALGGFSTAASMNLKSWSRYNGVISGCGWAKIWITWFKLQTAVDWCTQYKLNSLKNVLKSSTNFKEKWRT